MSRTDAHYQEPLRQSNAITARVWATFRLTAQLCVSVELEPVDVATTVVNQVIWLCVWMTSYCGIDADGL
jgi:hypothetical protein